MGQHLVQAFGHVDRLLERAHDADAAFVACLSVTASASRSRSSAVAEPPTTSTQFIADRRRAVEPQPAGDAPREPAPSAPPADRIRLLDPRLRLELHRMPALAGRLVTKKTSHPRSATAI